MSCFYMIVHFHNSELFPELRRFLAIRKRNRPVCTWCFFVTVPSGGGNIFVHIMFFSDVKLFPCADRGPQGRVSNPPLRCRLAEAGARGCAGGSDRNGHVLSFRFVEEVALSLVCVAAATGARCVEGPLGAQAIGAQQPAVANAVQEIGLPRF